MKVDDRIAPRARKNHTAILKALAEIGQARVAELIGMSPATVSRLKDDDLERLAGLLAAIGLKAVPESARFYSDARIRALTVLASEALNTDGSSEWGALD